MNNYRYEINNDYNASSPDDWGDDEVFLVYDHRNFTVKRDNFDPKDIYAYIEELNDDFDDYFIFPVYAYIHSGVYLSLNHNGDRWDTSMRGYAIISKTLRDDLDLELAKNYADDLIKEWNAYLSGEIYCYEIFDDTDEIIESCGGFYDFDECEKEAKYYTNNLNK